MDSNWPDQVVVNVVLDRVAEPAEEIAAATQRFVEAFEARAGATAWEVIKGPRWAGTEAELADVVRQHPSTAATYVDGSSDGYSFSLYARREPVVLSVGVTVGGPRLGKRNPAQTVRASVVHDQRGSVDQALPIAMFESLVEAWQPLSVQLTDVDINTSAGRGGWKIPAGYRVWLRDGVAEFNWLADGLTATPFAGGTVLAVPDDWPPDQIAMRLVETYERAGVEVLPH